LFADRKNHELKLIWINGINDWQHLTQKIIKHENCTGNVEVMKLQIIWLKNEIIDKDMD